MILTATILGVLGSLHCVGMCGPLALALPIPAKNKVPGIVLYNLGRSITYGFFGAIFGTFGAALSLAGWQQYFAILMAALIVIFILFPHVSSRLSAGYQQSAFITQIKSLIGRQFRYRTLSSSLIAGVLNGFLPCGMVYIAIAGALATGNPGSSVMFMVFFGLGTIPAMILLQYWGLKFKLRFRSVWVVPVLSLLMAFLFLYRGMAIELPEVENLLYQTGMNNISVCASNKNPM